MAYERCMRRLFEVATESMQQQKLLQYDLVNGGIGTLKGSTN